MLAVRPPTATAAITTIPFTDVVSPSRHHVGRAPKKVCLSSSFRHLPEFVHPLMPRLSLSPWTSAAVGVGELTLKWEREGRRGWVDLFGCKCVRDIKELLCDASICLSGRCISNSLFFLPLLQPDDEDSTCYVSPCHFEEVKIGHNQPGKLRGRINKTFLCPVIITRSWLHKMCKFDQWQESLAIHSNVTYRK